jgi:hypothetical protein
MRNVWEGAEILPMAIRLRKARRCPAEIDNLYGEIMRGIVKMASVLLPKDDPRYMCHRDEFLTDDVQSAMTLQVLGVAERLVDDRATPRSIVNYLVKTVQNRLRNYVRDTTKRRERIDIRTLSGVDFTEASVLEAFTIDGRRIEAVRDGRKRILKNQ